MNLSAFIRLIISASVAFCAYFAWAYYANSLVTKDYELLIKAALVQGTYSALITLIFSFLLEIFYKHLGPRHFCLVFITPRLTLPKLKLPRVNIANNESEQKLKISLDPHKCANIETFKHALQSSQKHCKGQCVPGSIVAPLPALGLQSAFVIALNIYFATPNLWLTVAPSIIFSAVYGYGYSFGLAKKALDETKAA